jgi:hypothetical protein
VLTLDADFGAGGLGRLVRRDAREVWSHEAHQFTPWLEQHIDQLNEAIGFEIELSGREQRVGPFAADLYGHEVQTGHAAIIENQLEATDHGHLGQLLTYAAGLKAGVVIWIAPKFRDEHREALTWLNEISPEDVNFFGIELEILEINGQRAANFKAVAQPNTWQKARRTVGRPGSTESSERQLAYQAYFAELLEALKASSPGITAASKTYPQGWFAFASGKSGVSFALVFALRQRFRAEVYIDTGDRDRNLAIFEALYEQRETIEAELGEALGWEHLEAARAKRISLYAPFTVSIRSPEQELNHLKVWAVPAMVKMVAAFRPRLRALSIL